MTIAELITELEKIKEEYGNLNVSSMCDKPVGVAVVGYFGEEDEEKSVILI